MLSTLLLAPRQHELRERQPLRLTLTSGFQREGLWRKLFMDLNGELFSASSSVKAVVCSGSGTVRITRSCSAAHAGRRTIESLSVGLEEGSKVQLQGYPSGAAL